MAARLVIQPVVVEAGVRKPLSATLVDPGRPAVAGEDEAGNPILVPRVLVHVSAISSGLPGERNADCCSLVAGVDLVNLDARAEVITLFEVGSDQPLAQLRDWLTSTPQQLGWSTAKRNRVIGRLTAVGANISGITQTSRLWEIVNRLGQVWMPGFDVRIVRTIAPGA